MDMWQNISPVWTIKLFKKQWKLSKCWKNIKLQQSQINPHTWMWIKQEIKQVNAQILEEIEFYAPNKSQWLKITSMGFEPQSPAQHTNTLPPELLLTT